MSEQLTNEQLTNEQRTNARPHNGGRPRVVVSQCLGFAPVRYNGAIIQDDFIQRLATAVDIVEVCPEVAIGLGVPRPPIRMQMEHGAVHLVQPSTRRDITTEMTSYSESFVRSLSDVDGFILKSRSPSCGFDSVSVFERDTDSIVGTRAGMFAHAVRELRPDFPAADEISLRDSGTRRNFLTAIFALARLRDALRTNARASLVAFHTTYKYLLMAYSPSRMTSMGRIVADAREDAAAAYERELRAILLTPPSAGGHANALMHMIGYLRDADGGARIALLHDVDRYRKGDLTLSDMATRLRTIIDAGDYPYLQNQAYFTPFPGHLA